MKKLILILTSITFFGCATLNPSKDELRKAPQCTVWKDGPLGTKHIAVVEGELAKQKMTCWVMNSFLCSYTNYTFRSGTNEILSDLPPKDKTIATVNGKKMTVDMKGITVQPFEIGENQITYSFKGPVGPVQTHNAEFNDKCSTRQVALGLLTIIAK